MTLTPLTPLGNDNFFVRNILSSRFEGGTTVRTYHMRYPRYIHAELMTHRVFSRNARSSRAVPNHKLLREPIVEPLIWGANQSGMQSARELEGWRLWVARATWHSLARITRLGVRIMGGVGLHKQWSNRPLEWFGSIDVLVTSVYWENFMVLRNHGAAMPEIDRLARMVGLCRATSEVQMLKPGEWHLPYIVPGEEDSYDLIMKQKLSVARCARISYVPFEGLPNINGDKALYKKLMGDIPIHASPSEHQCTPDTRNGDGAWSQPHLHGNLRGWIQFRKQHALEFFDEYNPRSY